MDPMETDLYPITDEMVETELAIIREHQLTDDEEIQRAADLDELFFRSLDEVRYFEEYEEQLRQGLHEHDSIDSLGLVGMFGP